MEVMGSVDPRGVEIGTSSRDLLGESEIKNHRRSDDGRYPTPTVLWR